MAITIKECEEHVEGPGKFEGEARYVPYFWDVYMDGGADDDDGTVLTFNVSDEDKKLFPELRGRKRVKLMEQDSGFVVELSPPRRATRSVCKAKLKSKKSVGVQLTLGGMR